MHGIKDLKLGLASYAAHLSHCISLQRLEMLISGISIMPLPFDLVHFWLFLFFAAFPRQSFHQARLIHFGSSGGAYGVWTGPFRRCVNMDGRSSPPTAVCPSAAP